MLAYFTFQRALGKACHDKQLIPTLRRQYGGKRARCLQLHPSDVER